MQHTMWWQLPTQLWPGLGLSMCCKPQAALEVLSGVTDCMFITTGSQAAVLPDLNLEIFMHLQLS